MAANAQGGRGQPGLLVCGSYEEFGMVEGYSLRVPGKWEMLERQQEPGLGCFMSQTKDLGLSLANIGEPLWT